MFDALVITLREGVEAALVLAIILAYIERTGRARLGTAVLLGLGAAVTLSIAAGLFFHFQQINPEDERIEGVLFGAAAILVVGVVWWMWRTAKSIKREIEAKLDAVTARTGAGAFAGVAFFTFFMVGREGVETVLLLAVKWTQPAADRAAVGPGALLGLALAVAFALFFIRTSRRIDLRLFFRTTSVVLLFFAVKLAANSAHEFIEVHYLPSTPAVMAVIGLFTKEVTSLFITVGLVAAPVFALVLAPAAGPAGGAAAADPEARKALAERRRATFSRLAAAATTLAVVVVLAGVALATAASRERPEPVEVAASGGRVEIALDDLAEGRFRVYATEIDGRLVRFFAFDRGPEKHGVVAALDTCELCPPKGFALGDAEVICLNCDAPLPVENVGEAGGCNPIPVPFTVEADRLRIDVEELRKHAFRFEDK